MSKYADLHDWETVIGKDLGPNKTFNSTSISDEGGEAVGARVYRVFYVCEPGTKGLYVSGDTTHPPISSFGFKEREVILAPGFGRKLIGVRRRPGGTPDQIDLIVEVTKQ